MNDATPDPLAAADSFEAALATQARELRGDATTLTADLFLKLWPLLRTPIPDGYIVTAPAVKGKPYESTGVKSVQVLIDRMNNVLTPLWWHDTAEYSEGGKLCKVTVRIRGRRSDNDPTGDPIYVERSSMGGVDRGSTLGNVYKGSYTNAAKRAFAMVGPGHEVYLGTTDLDPDTDPEASTEAPPATIGKAAAKRLIDRAWTIDEAKRNLQLAAMHVTGRDVGDCGTKTKAQAALAGLTAQEAERIDVWITQKAVSAAEPPPDQPELGGE